MGQLQLAALADTGELPATGFGLGARLGFKAGSLELDVGFRHLFERSAQISGTAASAHLQYSGGEVAGCWGLAGLRKIQFAPCVGMEAGAVYGVGTGISSPRRGAAAWLGVTVGARLSASDLIGPVGAVAGADLAAAAIEPRFVVGNLGVAFYAPRISARASAGLFFTF